MNPLSDPTPPNATGNYRADMPDAVAYLGRAIFELARVLRDEFAAVDGDELSCLSGCISELAEAIEKHGKDDE